MSLTQFVRAPLAAVLIAGAAICAPVTVMAQAASAAAAQASAPADAAPPAPAIATAPVANTVKETVDNPYGLEALWKGGDFVARGTLIIMIIMSLGSWYIIFTKLFEQRKVYKSAEQARDFWKAGSVKAGVNALPADTAFRYIAEQGLKSVEHHEGTLVDQIDLNSWIGMSVQRAVDSVNSRLQDGLAFLATVGSTAPFVGLFGTVWGIYHALTAIGIAGQASIDKVAGPVGEALIMTAFGLAVAVPAVMGYNWLVRRNKTAMERVRSFSSDLHNVLLAGSSKVVR